MFSPDGATLYVSSHGHAMSTAAGAHAAAGHDMTSPRANGTLAVIDAATGEVLRVTEVGPYPAALGLARIRRAGSSTAAREAHCRNHDDEAEDGAQAGEECGPAPCRQRCR